ncbi:nitrogen regulation protein NR(II) [Candidatus Sumerlaeota bacterium]
MFNLVDQLLRRARRLRPSPAHAALGAIGLILALFLGTWGYALHLVWESREEALGDRLLTRGERFVRVIENDEAAVLLEWADDDASGFSSAAGLPGTRAYDQLTSDVSQLLAAGFVSELQLIDAAWTILLDATDEHAAGDTFLLAENERPAFKRALRGESVAIADPDYRHSTHKIAYFPLRRADGRPVAVARLATPRLYADEVRAFRNRLALIAGAGIVLLLLVGWALYRTLQYLGRMEQTIARRDRLHSLGTLSAGLAHEMRNPLGIMRATAEEILVDVAGQQELEQLTKDIVGEIDRLNGLIRQVLEFSAEGRPPDGEQAVCRLHETVEAVLQMTRKNLNSADVELSYRPDDSSEELNVAIHANELRQVLLNLILNAVDAVGEQGRIELRSEVDLRHGKLALEVRDNGPGIPSELLERVCDPFYSAKPEGTGLGLAISRQVIERNGGWLGLISRGEGEGATARIVLNLA